MFSQERKDTGRGRIPEKFVDLLIFLAFTIQGTYQNRDLVSPMPEDTQAVGWDPERLCKLARTKRPGEDTQANFIFKSS